MTTTPNEAPAVPWWRVKTMWLVLGGPAAVVVSAPLTAVVAWRGMDPVVTQSTRLQAAESDEPSATPAMQARNHAATGGKH